MVVLDSDTVRGGPLFVDPNTGSRPGLRSCCTIRILPAFTQVIREPGRPLRIRLARGIHDWRGWD